MQVEDLVHVDKSLRSSIGTQVLLHRAKEDGLVSMVDEGAVALWTHGPDCLAPPVVQESDSLLTRRHVLVTVTMFSVMPCHCRGTLGAETIHGSPAVIESVKAGLTTGRDSDRHAAPQRRYRQQRTTALPGITPTQPPSR